MARLRPCSLGAAIWPALLLGTEVHFSAPEEIEKRCGIREHEQLFVQLLRGRRGPLHILM